MQSRAQQTSDYIIINQSVCTLFNVDSVCVLHFLRNFYNTTTFRARYMVMGATYRIHYSINMQNSNGSLSFENGEKQDR